MLNFENKINKSELEDVLRKDVSEDFLNSIFYKITPDNKNAWRYAWLLQTAFKYNKAYFLNNIDQFLNLLNQYGLYDEGTIRSILKIIDLYLEKHFELEIVENYLHLFEELLFNKSKAIAIRSVSLSIISKFLLKYPDLKNEISMSLHDEIPYMKPALKSKLKLFVSVDK